MISPGDIIASRYNVLSLLGIGGMAVVFECKDLYTNDTVAVKIIKEELLDDADSVADFKKFANSDFSNFVANFWSSLFSYLIISSNSVAAC